MSFEPTFNAELIAPVIEALATAITTQSAAALKWAHGGGDWPDFACVYRSEGTTPLTNFPWLIIVGENSLTEVNADNAALQAQHRIRIEFGLADSNPETVTTNCYQYARALAAIIWSMSAADFKHAFSVPPAGVVWDVTEQDYSPLLRTGSIYTREAVLIVMVTLWEQ